MYLPWRNTYSNSLLILKFVSYYRVVTVLYEFWIEVLFLCLEHLFLIVHCPWLCGYSCIRQSRHLSCFMDWLCTDEPSHSAQLEIVGTSIKSFPPQGEAGGCHFCLLLFAGVSGGEGCYSTHQFKPPSLFSPRQPDCANQSRDSKWVRLLLALWAALEKLGWWP